MSLSILLIPFFIFLIIFVMFALSAVYHIVRFELLNIITIFVTIVFGVGTFLIATISASYISDINWQEEITFDLFNSVSTEQTSEQDTNNILSF